MIAKPLVKMLLYELGSFLVYFYSLGTAIFYIISIVGRFFGYADGKAKAFAGHLYAGHFFMRAEHA